VKRLLRCIALAWAASMVPPAAPAAVDFARDIQPLFEKHCYECHGPKKQKNGFRLDRRSRAMAGVIRPNIVPGNSATSRVYRRILDGSAGTQMPLEDTLSDEQIETVRQWIDEGAHWPDELANEVDLPPPDAAALALIRQLRASGQDAAGRRAVLDSIAREPRAINARGPDGATPLMYASLYGDAEILGAMLRAGGNPNIASDSGATALMWAVEDIARVKLLLDAGADVNAVSGFERTPLALATLSPDTTAAAQLLLAHGANPTPLALAGAARGDENLVRAMVAAGAKDKGEAAMSALRTACFACMVALKPEPVTVPRGLIIVMPPAGPGDPKLVRAALERDADVKARDLKGRTTLMSLAISADVTPELMQTLIDRGADVHAKSPREGLNALDYALRLGRQPIIDVFTRAGLQPTAIPQPNVQFVAHNSVRTAVERSLPLLQQSSQTFYARSGCVACHHNLQAAITVKEARRAGFKVDESLAREELLTQARDLETRREQTLEGVIGGMATVIGYELIALQEQDFPGDQATDAQARLLRLMQRADGRWLSPYRPPIESSEITATAVSVRGLRAYGSDNPAASNAAIARAARWLEAAAPTDNEDRVFRLLGLIWADSSNAARQAAKQELLKTQQRDGGWAQTGYRSSDAYATGEALFALQAAGLPTSSRAYRKGIRYLLDTQLIDGSWLVRTRSLATQSYFESGFPHGVDQFISSAATHWATQALLLSLPDARPPAERKVAAR